jgi:hypothetical protein
MTMQTISYKRGLLHIDSNAISAFIVAKNEQGESKQFKTVRAAKEWLNRYNGHKNWNYWNVSLWINNDENLYSIARHMKQHYSKARVVGDDTRSDFIARQVLQRFKDEGIVKTPDGAPYTVSSIKAAIKDL